ncbi:MAG: RecQ family ATP-dependent DNA helicase [Prevotella sp.]|nr:RecQ family ATP-dependent DNA helicase [Prevotella sp.]
MDKYLDILHEYWGYPDFRGIQREIIESIGSGKDTLGLMPTGGGKSLTFQVPALTQKGVCIVISPLISLMKDQVDHLRQKNIGAAAIYSGMRRDDIVATLENCIFGGIKILYISPERVGSDLFKAKLLHMRVSFITVDEAHCISQWGYDFRPSYLQISEIRKLVPDAPVLALTATATPEVITDIQKQLGFEKENVFRMSFERKNLAYVVRRTESKEAETVHILQSVGGSAIVYVRSRKRTKQVAELLHNNGISATWYHAGLEPAEKAQRQEDWQNDKIRVIVATNAFGMGIDKPDVRLVIHPDAPSSIEAYFQEAGRAGRDGKKSYAVLLWNSGDERKLNKRIDDTFPPKDDIRDVYEHLAYFFQVGVNSGAGSTFEFNIDKFSRTFHFFPIRVNSALVILQRAGYIFYDPNPENLSRVKFLLTRNELYRLENQPYNEDAVITSLLRNYGGLFVDYVYIDESFVAKDSGLSRDEVYMALKALNHKRIINFIPRKNTPLVRYAIDRVDGPDVVLSEDVYDKRKKQFAKRIASVLEYLNNESVCRSRQLLAYFGETKSKDCGQCDVCISHKDNKETRDAFKDAQRQILEILDDGEKHFIRDLYKVKAWDSVLDEALEYLVQEEKVYVEGGFIRKA